MVPGKPAPLTGFSWRGWQHLAVTCGSSGTLDGIFANNLVHIGGGSAGNIPDRG
jgi:hypothetical protein